jgi:ribosomal protein S18 acetylase RimI-like enzyme
VTIAAAAAVAPRTDTSPDGLRAAIHDDLAASGLRRRMIPGERVIRTAELVAYASDLGSADVNEVAAARFGSGDAADAAIAATIALFAGRPFLWWVGEDDTPADLGSRLSARGVIFLDDIPGMAMDLADLADPADAPPPGLTIRPVLDAADMAGFHEVLIQGFPEDFADDGVEAEIGAASARVAAETGYREPNGLPTRWLGTVDGRPVTTTRLHTAAGVAGIYAVITADDARRRGYGEAVTRHVLRVARDAGLRIATLQASTAGRGIYERIGFRERCRFRLHEWRPSADR